MTIGKTHSTLGSQRASCKRHIESGGYGDVYLGHNDATGEDVAVKIGHERSIEVSFFIRLTILSIVFFSSNVNTRYIKNLKIAMDFQRYTFTVKCTSAQFWLWRYLANLWRHCTPRLRVNSVKRLY